MTEQDPRTILAELEASSDNTDRLMQRALTALRDMISDREALEGIARHATVARLATSSVLAEAACIVREQEAGASVSALMGIRRLAS